VVAVARKAVFPAEPAPCESPPVGTTARVDDFTAPHFDSSALLVVDVQVDYRVIVVEDAISRVTQERLADAVALGAHALWTDKVVRQVAGRTERRGSGLE
jgi:hypothetical protein